CLCLPLVPYTTLFRSFVIFDIVVWIVLAVATRVVIRIPIFGCIGGTILGFVWCFFWIGILVIHVVAIVKGINGQRFRLPVVSDLDRKSTRLNSSHQII